MPSRFYGKRKSYKSGYKKTGKKVYSSKRTTYYKKKRAGPSFKKYSNYSKRTGRSHGYPQLKKSNWFSPIQARDMTFCKFGKDLSGRWFDSGPVINQGKVHVLPLTGEPTIIHAAYARAFSETGDDPKMMRVFQQLRKITFVIGSEDLTHPAVLNGGMEMDIYFFVARVDIGAGSFSTSDYEGMFNYLYDVEQTDAVASDLTHPNFTPFMSAEWCKRFKMYKHEKVILDEKKRTHTILDVNKRSFAFNENSYSDGTTANAIKGVTRLAVICTRGVLGLCDGVGSSGSTLGYPMYTPLPQAGWLSHYESTSQLVASGNNPSYYIDATTQPTGGDHVVVTNLTNVEAPVS